MNRTKSTGRIRRPQAIGLGDTARVSVLYRGLDTFICVDAKSNNQYSVEFVCLSDKQMERLVNWYTHTYKPWRELDKSRK